MIKFGLKQLFSYNIHLGYHKSRWNPQASVFLYGIRNNVHIINLEYTLFMLRRALYFIKEVVANRGNILFVNLTMGSYRYLLKGLKKSKQFAVNFKYIGGLLTNFKNVKVRYKSLAKMKRLPSAVIITKLIGCEGIVSEAKRLNIPLIGVSDSNMLPVYFTYPIPGNVESIISIKFYYAILLKAIYAGILKRRLYYYARRWKKNP